MTIKGRDEDNTQSQSQLHSVQLVNESSQYEEDLDEGYQPEMEDYQGDIHSQRESDPCFDNVSEYPKETNMYEDPGYARKHPNYPEFGPYRSPETYETHDINYDTRDYNGWIHDWRNHTSDSPRNYIDITNIPDGGGEYDHSTSSEPDSDCFQYAQNLEKLEDLLGPNASYHVLPCLLEDLLSEVPAKIEPASQLLTLRYGVTFVKALQLISRLELTVMADPACVDLTPTEVKNSFLKSYGLENYPLFVTFPEVKIKHNHHDEMEGRQAVDMRKWYCTCRKFQRGFLGSDSEDEYEQYDPCKEIQRIASMNAERERKKRYAQAYGIPMESVPEPREDLDYLSDTYVRNGMSSIYDELPNSVINAQKSDANEKEESPVPTYKELTERRGQWGPKLPDQISVTNILYHFDSSKDVNPMCPHILAVLMWTQKPSLSRTPEVIFTLSPFVEEAGPLPQDEEEKPQDNLDDYFATGTPAEEVADESQPRDVYD